MFKAIRPDVLLTLSLVDAGQTFRVENVSSMGGEVVLRLTPGEGGMATVRPLRQLAGWRVNGKDFGKWLSEEVAAALDGVRESQAGRRGQKRAPPRAGAPGVGTGQVGSEAAWRWLRIESVVGPDGAVDAAGLSRLQDMVREDERQWAPGQQRSEEKGREVSARAESGPGGFLHELRRAAAEAQAQAAGVKGPQGLEPFLARALERYWGVALRESEMSALTGGHDLAGRVVVALERVRDPKAKDAGKDWLSLEPATGEGGGEGRVVTLSVSFAAPEVPHGECGEFVARVRFAGVLAGDIPRLADVERRLGPWVGDVHWALARFFEDGAMTIFADKQLAFPSLDLFERWLPPAATAGESLARRKLIRLAEAVSTGRLHVGGDCSAEERDQAVGKWLAGWAE